MNKTITYKRIWDIAWPIILGSMAQNIITVTDTAFLGRVGEVALGAGAIGGIFYLTLVMLGWGFGIGTQIIVARRYGEGKDHEIGRVVEHAMYFLIPISIFLIFFMRLFSNQLLDVLLTSDQVLEASVEYLNIRSFGLLFAFFNMAFRALYIGIAKTRVITWSTLVMAAVNVSLNYIFIFGKLGLAPMGIRGAALASFIAEIAATSAFIIYTSFDTDLARFHLFRFRQFSILLYGRIIRIAAPVMFQNFFSILVWFLFFIFVESMGEHALAISNIIRSIYVVLMVPIWGFASAANTLVSFTIGRGKPEQVLKVTWKIVHLSVLSVTILVGLNLIAPTLVLGLYTNEASLIRDGLPVLHVISGSALFIAAGFIFFSAVSGTGKTQIALILESVALAMYLVYSYTMLKVFHASVTGIWTAEFLYGSFLIILSYGYLKTGHWRKAKM